MGFGQFYKINEKLRCGKLVLKQNFTLLDHLLLSYIAVSTVYMYKYLHGAWTPYCLVDTVPLNTTFVKVDFFLDSS